MVSARPSLSLWSSSSSQFFILCSWSNGAQLNVRCFCLRISGEDNLKEIEVPSERANTLCFHAQISQGCSIWHEGIQHILWNIAPFCLPLIHPFSNNWKFSFLPCMYWKSSPFLCYQFERLAFYLIELCLVEHEALNYKPSMLCASAIYIARCTMQLTPRWTPLLAKHSRYEESQIRFVALYNLLVLGILHHTVGKSRVWILQGLCGDDIEVSQSSQNISIEGDSREICKCWPLQSCDYKAYGQTSFMICLFLSTKMLKNTDDVRVTVIFFSHFQIN